MYKKNATELLPLSTLGSTSFLIVPKTIWKIFCRRISSVPSWSLMTINHPPDNLPEMLHWLTFLELVLKKPHFLATELDRPTLCSRMYTSDFLRYHLMCYFSFKGRNRIFWLQTYRANTLLLWFLCCTLKISVLNYFQDFCHITTMLHILFFWFPSSVSNLQYSPTDPLPLYWPSMVYILALRPTRSPYWNTGFLASWHPYALLWRSLSFIT